MIRSRASLSIVTVLLFVVLFSGIADTQTKLSFIPDEVAVIFAPSVDASQAEAMRVQRGATLIFRSRLINGEVWKLAEPRVERVAAELAADDRIEVVEPSYLVELDDVYPNDERFDEMWGLHNLGESAGRADADIDAPRAWRSNTDASSIIVGIVDSGVDYHHPDLRANIYTNPGEIPDNNIDDDNNGFIDDVHGWDFGDDDNAPTDQVEHGTHVAGTVGAVGNNGIGVVGVNWRVQIMPLKIADSQGQLSAVAGAMALEYATLMGARVTNHSYGGENPSAFMRRMIEAVQEQGVLFVASAGNAGVEIGEINQHFPAGYEYDAVVSVANTTRDDQLAGSSNYSATRVDLGAPGSRILSTLPGNKYGSYSGTSMSAPHVSGAIAAVWAVNPSLTAAQVKALLMDTGDPLPDLDGTTVSGRRLNLANALRALDPTSPAPVTDLVATPISPTSVALQWTATGDDDASGGAAYAYDLRMSPDPIVDETAFAVARPVFDVGAPGEPGASDGVVVDGLSPGGTVHFALKVVDHVDNHSALSTPASATTPVVSPSPVIDVSARQIVKTLVTGATETRTLQIYNDGDSPLHWTALPRATSFVPGVVRETPDGPVLVPGDDAPAAVTLLEGVNVRFDVSRGQADFRWDAVVSALEARGATVLASVDTFTTATLDGVDILWLAEPRVPASLHPGEAGAIARWLREGGGLVLEGDNEWGVDLFNQILWESEAGIAYRYGDGVEGITTDITAHPVTAGVGSVLIYQNTASLYLTGSDADVVVRDAGGAPVVAVSTVGAGHVLAMADEVFDEDHVDVGSSRLMADNAFSWLALELWLRMVPAGGAVAAGDSQSVNVLLSAEQIAGGIYQGEVILRSDDAARPETGVAVTLAVAAAPDIQVVPTSIDYGVVFNVVADTASVQLLNAGPAQLDIFDIRLDSPHFSFIGAPGSILPDSVMTIDVVASPSGVGAVTADLVIFTNDPDESRVAIPLWAQSEDPPVASVSPDSIVEVAFGDQVLHRTMTIRNDGGYDLDYSILVQPVFDATSAQRVPSAPDGMLRATMNGETLGPPSDLGGLQGVSDSPDAPGGGPIMTDDFEDGNYDDWIDRGGTGLKEVTDETAAHNTIYSFHESESPFGHFDSIQRRFGATQPSYFSVHIRCANPDKAEGYVVLGSSQNLIVAYVYFSSGGLLCVQASNPGEDCSIIYDTNRWYHVEFKNIDFDSRTFDYWVDGVPIADRIPFMVPADDIASVLIYNYHEGSEAWWDEFVVSQGELASWIDTDPPRGTIAPGASQDVDVTLNATVLFSGIRKAQIRVSSNDPLSPLLTLPVSVDVTAVPNIFPDPDTLEFGEVVVGDAKRFEQKIRNFSAQENLVISSITTSDPQFTVNQSAMLVPPASARPLFVTFRPTVYTSVAASMTITSNDRDEPVKVIPLFGTGKEAPVLLASPDTLVANVYSGTAVVETLLVTNNTTSENAADLELSLWERDNDPRTWLTISPKLSVIPPGSTQVVTLRFDAGGLFEGAYPADIMASVNIPGAELQVAANTVMNVGGDPALLVADTLVISPAYAGAPAEAGLLVRNGGTAQLVVDSLAAGPALSLSHSTLSIAPGDSAWLGVTLSVSAPGPVVDAIQFFGDGGLLGTTLVLADVKATPVGSVAPLAVSRDVPATRERTGSISIHNNGLGVLEWSLDVRFPGASAAKSGNDGTRAGAAAVQNLVRVRWQGTHGPLGSSTWSTAFADIGAMGGTVSTGSGAITREMLEGYDVLWLGDETEPPTSQELAAIVDWVRDGNALLVELGNSVDQNYMPLLEALGSGITLGSTVPGGGVASVIVPHEMTRSVNAIQQLSTTVAISSVAAPGEILANGPLTGIMAARSASGDGRVVVMNGWPFCDLAVNTLDNRRFMRQAFAWLTGTAWFSATPLYGSLGPGVSTTVDLTFAATDLAEDTYAHTLRVATNDPITPHHDVALSMTVTPLVPRSISLSLDDGLNLRSFNLALDDTGTRSVFGPVLDQLVSVQGFDGGGVTFDPDVPDAFNTLRNVDHLHGYWVRTEGAASLPLDGYAVDPSEPIALDEGYNLVGFLPESPDSVLHALQSVMPELEVAMGYDGGGLTFDPDVPPEFNTLQVMRPGYGYWVRVGAEATLVYPDPLPAPATAAVVAAAPSQHAPAAPAKIVPTSEWISIWGDEIRVNGDAIPAGTEILVSDPQGVVCGVGRFHADGRFRMVPVYRDDPATELDEGAEPGDRLVISIGDEFRFEGIEWRQRGEVVAFQEVARLSAGSAAPVVTALHQNFPNPFNPTTTVPYDVAVAGNVTVTIFSVTGGRIRTLVDEHHGPGRYRAPWDGRDERGNGVASGVYFYRLTAPGVTLTRKMVVVR